ncbi:MAG: Gfo/Idh/MocA family oxidoreductase [Acidobacteria bacterium]|nr:Gfo/Idh/MocA family oxidoreductase [Acidobacteriota bacterium]
MTRIAIIGLGGVAERIHIPACRALKTIELAGACETNPETRGRMAEKFGLQAVYPDAATLLAKEKPDAVIVGTPPDAHYELCLLALEHGAHVFCEKPFMRTLEEADEVIAAARAKNLLLAVNNQYRYMPIYRRTRERLERGDFGRLYFVQCWQQMFHPPTAEKVAWRAALKQSTLYEFGTHALDLICHFFGALPEALTAQIPRARADFDSDVLVLMTLRFTEDRVATLALNRVSQAPERYLEMRLDCEQASLRLSLGGVARASVEWSKRLGRPTARLSFVKGGEARKESGGRSVAYVKEKRPAFMSATAAHLERFVAAVESGARDYAAAAHAREVLRLALAGYQSALSGETVWLRR